MIINFIWSSNLLKTPLVHYCDPVGHVDCFLLIMGDIKEGNAHFLLKTLQLQLHSPPKLQIQCPQRLIQKKHFRIICQRPCNSHPLALTTGKLMRFALLISF